MSDKQHTEMMTWDWRIKGMAPAPPGWFLKFRQDPAPACDEVRFIYGPVAVWLHVENSEGVQKVIGAGFCGDEKALGIAEFFSVDNFAGYVYEPGRTDLEDD